MVQKQMKNYYLFLYFLYIKEFIVLNQKIIGKVGNKYEPG